MQKPSSRNWLHYMALGSTIAFTMAGASAGGYFLGAFLDRHLGTEPLLTILLMIGGVILGLSYMIISLSKIGKDDNER